MLSSEVLLVAIAVVLAIAVALLIGPVAVWIRTRIFRSPQEESLASDGDATLHARPEATAVTSGASAQNGSLAEAESAAPGPLAPGGDGLGRDRTVRIVSWAFLMAVAVYAAASGVWVATLPAIVILVAITGEANVLIQDILPLTRLRPAGGPLQAVIAIAFGSGLIVLTGGLESPFALTFPLIVGAGALLVRPRAAVLLTLTAAAAYLAAGLVGSPEPATRSVVQLLVNMTGLFLLAYIGASVGREHRSARDAAIRLSTIDSLTDLSNRSFFFTALDRELARGDRSGRSFCLVMLDLDDLKSINDRAGHHAGDQVLRNVADVVRSRIRKIDVAARYGGDEFVVLLPETDPTGGWVFAEKIRQTIAEQGVPGLQAGPTISIGVVSYPADGRTADALVVSADRAMYASKRGGKNRVARASTDSASAAADDTEPSRATGRPG